MKQYFTIGMAGHIDHGKTTLTKALTGINTDRLKEEKERKISIEPGFALLFDDDQYEVTIIDVPGHERFIRQMIAGVAGIQMVLLVIAGDEGIMPQTREHLNILSLLGIEHGLIVITKIDETDSTLLEIIKEDIQRLIQGTFLEGAPIFNVDSLSNKGISQLKTAIKAKLPNLQQKYPMRPFRLPIDQVFTVKGQGVVVRGTVYDGEVEEGDYINLLPQNKTVRIRQIQRHHKRQKKAAKGQRAALNLGGISHQEIKRGNVLVKDHYYPLSNRLDLVFHPLDKLNHPIKQRQKIKLHLGTVEVMGRIIFFDRNLLHAGEEEVLCQIHLEEEIVATREDRFILRRPTPVETLGGGWVLDPQGKKYRFHEETIRELQLKKTGTLEERIIALFSEHIVLTMEDLAKYLSVSKRDLQEGNSLLFQIDRHLYTLRSIHETLRKKILKTLTDYHHQHPMRRGMNKAEILSRYKDVYSERLVQSSLEVLEQTKKIKVDEQYVYLEHFNRSLPEKWRDSLMKVKEILIHQGVEVSKWEDLVQPYDLPEAIREEFYHYLIETKVAYMFDEDRLISREAAMHALEKLAEKTKQKDFTLQEAREILQLTRKNLIPLLELFDTLGYTKRIENKRLWLKKR